MKHSLSAIGCGALACLLAQPAAAWTHGGATTANGHEAAGPYGNTSNTRHDAATWHGGPAEAGHGSWSSTSATGHANSGSHGTTTYGTRYAVGSYGWVVAANDGHVVAIGTYGTHDGGGAAGGGAQHPPAVVSPYYGVGCYDCGGWGGVAVPPTAMTVNYANASSATLALASPAYSVGDVYAAPPAGYAYRPIGGNAYYFRDGIWFSPHYGANGMDYRVLPPP